MDKVIVYHVEKYLESEIDGEIMNELQNIIDEEILMNLYIFKKEILKSVLKKYNYYDSDVVLDKIESTFDLLNKPLCDRTLERIEFWVKKNN